MKTTEILHEYRLVMPLTLEEYRKSVLFSYISTGRKMIEQQRKRGYSDGIRLKSENRYPCPDALDGEAIETRREIVLEGLLPKWSRGMIRLLLGISKRQPIIMDEASTNAYPSARTRWSLRGAEDKFDIEMVTMILENDRGEKHNPLNLTDKQISKREIFFIDPVEESMQKHISTSSSSSDAIDRELNTYHYCDLAQFEYNGRGPYRPRRWVDDLRRSNQPYLCVYRCLFIRIHGFPFRGLVRSRIVDYFRLGMPKYHVELVCSMPEWADLSVEDLLRMELEVVVRDLDDDTEREEGLPLFV